MSSSDSNEYKSHHTGSVYGAFAFGSVILSCFAGYFFYSPRFFSNEWMMLTTLSFTDTWVGLHEPWRTAG